MATIVKQEPQELTSTPDFINSLAEIRNLSTALSTALSAFCRRYDDLQNHLKTAIDSKLPDQLNHLALIPLPETSPKPSLPEPVNPITKPDNTTNSDSKPDSQKPNLKSKPDSRKPKLKSKSKPESQELNLKSKPESQESILKSKPESEKPNLKSKPESEKPNLKSKPESEKPNLISKPESEKPNLISKPESEKPNLKSKPDSTTDDSVTEAKCQKPARSVLERLCESMCGRSVRKYIAAHLSDSTKLREEVPKALKLASNPPKLILASVGRFYLQGSRAYTKEHHMTEHRRASVLALECFLLMGCEGIEIENDVEREAAEAAVAWRKRIVSEGGFGSAAEIDARGLLMLISGFGIPKVFTNEDVREVIMATKVKSISSALRRSSNLVTRIPSIVELMVKKNLEVKAADIAYSLGLEDKCSPKKILTTFLHHTTKSKMQGSSEEVRTAKKKQLADLKSIIRCLEDHKIDPSDLLPESKIDEKIKSLEKEITELDKKAKEKEKEKEKEREKEKEKAAVKRKADETDTSNYWKKSEDAKRTRFPGSNINGYSASSPSIIPHESRRPEDVYGQPPAGQMMSQAYAGQSQSQSYAAVPSQGDAALLSERLLSQAYAGQSYAAPFSGDTTLSERLLSQGYGGQTYAAPTALSERLVSQSYGGQTYGSLSGLTSLYRPSSHLQSSLEGFAGLPSHTSATSSGVWNRGSGSNLYQFADSVRGSGSGGSDLYQFADSVVESESYKTSSSNRAGGAHRSSYLY